MSIFKKIKNDNGMVNKDKIFRSCDLNRESRQNSFPDNLDLIYSSSKTFIDKNGFKQHHYLNCFFTGKDENN